MCTFENKIVKRIGLLYCPKCLLSKLFLNYIYFPYIHSYLNYVNISWASTYQIKLKAIHQLQKWALRSIFNENNMTLSRPLLQSVNDLYVYQINLFQHLHFIYNFNKNETPINFNNSIKKNLFICIQQNLEKTVLTSKPFSSVVPNTVFVKSF